MPARAVQFVLLLLLFTRLTGDCLAVEVPKRVLILDSFGGGVAPFSVVVSALRTELNRLRRGPTDVLEFSLEAARSPQPKDEDAIAEFLRNRMQGNAVDIVITVGHPATDFAARYRERLFSNTPMIITCMDPRRVTAEMMGPQTTMLSHQADLQQIVRDILTILPETREIAVVFGVSPLEQYWKRACEREFASFSDRIEFHWWDTLSFEEMKKRAAKLPENSVVLYGLLLRDAAGVAIDQQLAVRELSEVSNSPLVGTYESQIRLGIIGGRLIPDHSLGKLVARAATRILRGEAVSQVPPQTHGPRSPIYDWRELDRFGISESRLPAGSKVLYRPTTLWEAYRLQLLLVGTVIVLQLLLIGGLLAQRRRRARAERALAANEQRLQLITDSLPVLIAYVDRDQRYQFNNRAFESWFGIDPQRARGRLAREVLGERLSRTVRPFSDRALAGEQVSFAVDTVLADGRPIAVEGIFVPDRDEQGEVRGFYALVMDVTSRNQAWRDAGQLRDELAHAGRVSLMGVLSAALAHELNQPLTAIMSNAQAARRFLKEPSPNLQEIAEILEDIASDDERASHVIRRLRALVRKEPSDFKLLDVAEMVSGVEKIVHSDAIMRQCSLVLDVEPELRQVRGDRVQLQQVLLNLILNAFDALEASSASERTVSICARQADQEVVIAVRDRGPGIAEEIHAGLFEPFQSSKKQGLGMGLSISRSIAELHGGQLWGESNPDVGATFYLTLPTDVDPTALRATTKDRAHAGTLANSLRSR